MSTGLKTTFYAGVSPCPNDSFIFGAWVLGMTNDLEDLRTRFVWKDVQTLNEMADSGAGDLIKVSAVQALRLEREWSVLSCGGAFAQGQGPKLVVSKEEKNRPRRIAVPGMTTTALALLRACLDYSFVPVPMPFDQIPDAVLARQVDGGLLIHETALIHDQLGLRMFIDLGAWWNEQSSGLPLPLGAIIIKRSLGERIKSQTEEIIRQSIRIAWNNQSEIMPYIRQLATELDDDVINRHIRAYVNDCSFDMGKQGKTALSFLKEIA